MAERALLLALGGNCHSAVAVLSRWQGGQLLLRAALFSPDGSERVEGEAQFDPLDMSGPKALAAELLARSSPAITRHFTGA